MYTSCGFCSVPSLFQWSYVPAVTFSVHLSGMANGRRQFVALAFTTRALAVARTPCDVIPSSGPKNVGSATLVFEPSRYTFTRTHLPEKPGGQLKKTSTPEEAPVCFDQTGFANGAAVGQPPDLDAHSAVNVALLSGTLVALLTSSKASAVAPARAPASAAVCACPLPTQSTPWSTTNVINAVSVRSEIATWTRTAPCSPLPRPR